MITTDQVKETEAYKGLSKMLQKMVVSRNNMKNAIQHGVSVVNNIGFDAWDKQTTSRPHNRLIIQELTGNNQ